MVLLFSFIECVSLLVFIGLSWVSCLRIRNWVKCRLIFCVVSLVFIVWMILEWTRLSSMLRFLVGFLRMGVVGLVVFIVVYFIVVSLFVKVNILVIVFVVVKFLWCWFYFLWGVVVGVINVVELGRF